MIATPEMLPAKASRSSRSSHPGKARVIPAKESLLLPYQAAWVRDNSRLKIAEKSRQIGWTWATAYGLVRRKAMKTARQDAWISSRDDMQARLFLEDSKSFAAILQTGAADLGERAIDEARNSAYVIEMANKLRIHSMSSNPDAQAGKRGDRVLDEFALHPDPRKLYAIAYYGITWGGSMEIFSTHRGSHNFFNELINQIKYKGNPKGFSLHRVTLQDALDQGFLFKLQQKLPPDDPRQDMDEAAYFDMVKRESPDEETFAQECMCVPSNDNAAFLSYDLIASCEYKPDESWEWTWQQFKTNKNPLYAGVDIGRDHDLTALYVFEKYAGTYNLRKRIELKAMPFSEQEATIYPYLGLASLQRACMDQTGIGRQFVERAQAQFGTTKIEGISFTGPVKEMLAYPVRSAFEDRSIRIPSDTAIRADLRAIKKETTVSGNIRFTADHGANGHSDRFWAIALALLAGKTTAVAQLPYITSISQRRVASRRGGCQG